MKNDNPEVFHENKDNAWINTYSGKRFFPLNPRKEDLSLVDIAHSLAHQCRWTGHCRFHFSISQHSCYAYDFCEDEEAKPWALFHDSPEAYLVDVARPIKAHLGGYKDFENKIAEVVIEEYSLPFSHRIETVVKKIDSDLLVLERENLINKADFIWGYEDRDIQYLREKFPNGIPQWTPAEAEHEFLKRAVKVLTR